MVSIYTWIESNAPIKGTARCFCANCCVPVLHISVMCANKEATDIFYMHVRAVPSGGAGGATAPPGIAEMTAKKSKSRAELQSNVGATHYRCCIHMNCTCTVHVLSMRMTKRL